MSDEEMRSSCPASSVDTGETEENNPTNEVKASIEKENNCVQDSRVEYQSTNINEEIRSSSPPSAAVIGETEENNDSTNAVKEAVQKENDCVQDSRDEYQGTDSTINDNTCVTSTKSNEINGAENENAKTKSCDNSEKTVKTTYDSYVRSMKNMQLLQKIDELDEKHIREYLKDVSKDDLLDALKEIEQINSHLLKENQLYEFILNEDDTVQNSLESAEVDEDLSVQETFVLSYPAKCYFAEKKLEQTKKELELKKARFAHELQNLNFELESLNMSLKDLSESKEKFDKNIRIGGRHPVTKKIVLQKVAKFFDDSIRNKMALTNRYRIQIQSDVKERNKILSQIKAQEKRLASLDMTEFREGQFEHEKSCKELAKYKEQLGKLKAKFSSLSQNITDLKRDLEREENEMERMKSAVSKLEHLKDVMIKEKARNDQKVQELKATMRKIKLDPRRHNLPEVIDYAAAKREHAALIRNINKWKKKVELVQQEKLLYLNAVSKKNIQ